MEYVELGKTGVEVSRICFGTWAYGGDWGDPDLQQAREAIRGALDTGINFFDTARAYGFGVAESTLSEALDLQTPSKRERVVVATKGGLRDAGDRHVRDSRPQELREGLEHSLRALRTDYVDVFLIHYPDPQVELYQVGEALQSFLDEGLVRYVGVSNFDVDQLSDLQRHVTIAAVQPPLHIFRREATDLLLPYCREHQIGVFSYSALAHGFLTGRFGGIAPTFPQGDWREKNNIFRARAYEVNSPIVDQLAAFAATKGHAVGDVAIAWVLSQSGNQCGRRRRPLCRAGTALVSAVDMTLTPADLDEIEQITKGFVPVGGASPGNIW